MRAAAGPSEHREVLYRVAIYIELEQSGRGIALLLIEAAGPFIHKGAQCLRTELHHQREQRHL